MTIRQGASLTARCSFEFRNPETGRKVTIRQGQRFWVTSSATLQSRENAVRIDREGKGHISHGWPFAPASIADLFAAEP